MLATGVPAADEAADAVREDEAEAGEKDVTTTASSSSSSLSPSANNTHKIVTHQIRKKEDGALKKSIGEERLA